MEIDKTALFHRLPRASKLVVVTSSERLVAHYQFLRPCYCTDCKRLREVIAVEYASVGLV